MDDDQARVDEAPAEIELGLAVRLTVGADADEATVTVTDFETDPPAPVQAIPYDVVAEGDTLFDPDNAIAPLQPPDALHDVALAEDHANVDAVPAVIDEGLAERLAVGAAVVLAIETVTDLVTERDPPWQVNENVLGAVTAKVC